VLKLSWYCLDSKKVHEEFVVQALEDLIQLLKSPRVELELDAKRLDEQCANSVNWKMRGISPQTDRPFAEWCASIRSNLPDLNRTPLLIYCTANSAIAKAAVKENDLAKWGLTNDQFAVSAVYRCGNKYILWHEVLHLFDAVDCYCYANPQAGPNCELTNCLMQYVPTEHTVGEWPFLCRKNIIRIQNWSKKHKQDKS
jgi:hypothetical protein